MDAFNFGGLKMDDKSMNLKFHSFKTVTKLFRIVELCFGLVLLSWTSTRLPFAVKLSGEYFWKLVAVIFSPLFIFLISNFIVLTLLFKSGRLSGHSPTAGNGGDAELYESFVENADCSTNPEKEEVVYEDKQTIFEMSKQTTRKSSGSEEIETVTDKVFDSKFLRRTQSEKVKEGNSEEICVKNLRRSETEKWRKVSNSGEVTAETACEVEELSNEEFQKAIEDFIAKQIKFHQEEKLAIVPHSQA